MDLRKDIYFFADFASFPASGSTGVLYVDKDTGFIYSWNGATFLASGTGGLNYLGTWDANANSPSITSGIGSAGDYYIVGTPGTTNIDGISSWDIGDWIIFGGTAWQKIDNSETTGYVTSVSGTAPISSSGSTTPTISISKANGSTDGYLSSTDWNTFNGKTPTTRNITINGTTQDLAADRTWSVGTVTSVAALTLGTTGTDLSSTVATGTTTPVITLNVPTASATNRGVLSTGDWSTFNGKQNAITLTTTGTSGAATLVGSTLNVPQYAGGLTNFTEAANSSAPNATVPVNSLTATGAATNIDAAIIPKGTGALMLDIPDNTTAGGNKRGANAIDLQHGTRSNADKVASGQYSVAIGYNNRAYNTYAVALGGGVFSGGSQSVGFQSGTATGTFGFAHGSRCNSTGYGSVAFGAYIYADTTASGDNSFAVGAATASGLFAIAMSESNVASAQDSCAIGGRNNLANSYLGYASGGYSTTNGVEGRQARGRALGTVQGETQKSEFFLSIRTTGNTPAAVTVAGGSPGTTNQVILSNNSAYRFKGTILGKQSGSTNVAAWDVDGLIVRGANAVSTTLVVGNVNLVSNASSWGTPTLSADPFNGGLQVQVTGAAATNIQWTAVIETTEVIYA